jgi:hypothetical protein
MRVEAVFTFWASRRDESSRLANSLGHLFLLIVTIRLASVSVEYTAIEPGKVG